MEVKSGGWVNVTADMLDHQGPMGGMTVRHINAVQDFM